ncbi:MAG: DedA family protein [Paracoccaceae bacterium]|nr:DedA family protein [Paracoccaceae bacterium]MDP7184176.1 DedA family protein [Paracoccaceae bacterium]
MSDVIFSLVTSYGAIVVLISAFLSCLLVPIPTSLMMLAAGAFVATGDLSFWQVFGGALLGAVAGDQTGFQIGRRGGAPLVDRLKNNAARAKVIGRAQRLIDRYGGVGVFFSTWLFAPLGPWVNFVAGAARLNWWRFTIWDTLGELIWVSVYVGVGFTFAANISAASEVAGDVIGILAALALAGAMILWIVKSLRAHSSKAEAPAKTA